MEKKILVALDGAPASRASHLVLDYLAMLHEQLIADLAVTLFHVVKPAPPPLVLGSEHDQDAIRLAETIQRHKIELGQTLLADSQARLVKQGFDPKKIETRVGTRGLGLANEILLEAEQGMFDAVLLGQRGLGKVEAMILGSVTTKVVQHAGQVPVWTVGGRKAGPRILLAVDNSEGSERAVDHLAFILDEGRGEVTLFHVTPHPGRLLPPAIHPEDFQLLTDRIFRKDLADTEQFMDRAQGIFAAHGLGPPQVKIAPCEPGGSLWRTILKEVKQGDCGTVVLGRRGAGQAHFLGQVAHKVLGHCHDAAVWIVG
jgi:nucleotide-binding universal stress UspA family protein